MSLLSFGSQMLSGIGSTLESMNQYLEDIQAAEVFENFCNPIFQQFRDLAGNEICYGAYAYKVAKLGVDAAYSEYSKAMESDAPYYELAKSAGLFLGVIAVGGCAGYVIGSGIKYYSRYRAGQIPNNLELDLRDSEEEDQRPIVPRAIRSGSTPAWDALRLRRQELQDTITRNCAVIQYNMRESDILYRQSQDAISSLQALRP